MFAKVLVLNKAYIPVKFISSLEAVCKIYTKRAEVISPLDNFKSFSWDEWIEESKIIINESIKNKKPIRYICSETLKVAVPKTIRCLYYNKIPKVKIRLSKHNIYVRDEFICYICNKKISERELSIDHIVPISKGGKTEWTNVLTCCKPCNAKKGDKTLQELGIKIKKLPFEPNLSNVGVLKTQVGNIEDEWLEFSHPKGWGRFQIV